MRLPRNFSRRHIINNGLGSTSASTSTCGLFNKRLSSQSSILFEGKIRSMMVTTTDLFYRERFQSTFHRSTIFDPSRCVLPFVPAVSMRQYRTNSYKKKITSTNKPKNNTNQYTQPSKRVTFGPISTIQQAQSTMQHILDRLDEMNISPPNVTMMRERIMLDLSDEQYRRLNQTSQNTQKLFGAICHAVEQGHLHPSQKHAKELSRLAECVLYSYSCCCCVTGGEITNPESSKSHSKTKVLPFPFSQLCQQVLNTLKKEWNLDIQNSHYQHAIAVANQEQNFKLASDLFERQIDPNAGRPPVNVSMEDPQGLYAVAKLHSPPVDDQESPSTAAEHVMDAVQRLVMVSPHDQTTYILAAGNALGYAGRWQDLLEYWNSSLLSQQWGTPLVAAVMQACWLCQQPNQAWDVLEKSNLLVLQTPLFSSSSKTIATTPGFGGEWQYGGQRDRMDPVVRDVAMKVVTSFQPVSNDNQHDDVDNTIYLPSVSQVALELYHQSREEQTTISLDALTGVVLACEQDGEWQEALSILWSVLDAVKDSPKCWIVRGNSLLIEDISDPSSPIAAGRYDVQTLLWDIGSLLASTMRSCNASSNYGISLFLLALLQTQISPFMLDGKANTDQVESLEQAIHHLLSQLRDSEPVLLAGMVALCGVRCYEHAVDLFQFQDDGSSHSVAVHEVYEYVKSNQNRFGTLVVGNPWIGAQRHIMALAQAVQRCKSRKSVTGQDGTEHVSQILSVAMNCCIHAHQPQLSLQLLQWVDKELFQSSMAAPNFVIGTGPLHDSVTAEYILALRWANQVPEAISVFEKCVETHGYSLSEWRKTVSAGLEAMVAGGRGNDALKILQITEEDALCNDCFSTLGRHLSNNAEWKDLINLYRDASARGFYSEELSFMAMRAVTLTRIDNRLRILRAIVGECASNAGVDQQVWLTSRYWNIKRELGFEYARLLMWWNDPDSVLLDELILAIKEYDKELAQELRPKNDGLRVIVNGAGLFYTLELYTLKGYDRIPKTISQWLSMLEEVLKATQGSPLHSDPRFIDSVVQAYKTLGCSRECIAYIKEIMEHDFIKLRKSTLKVVLEAARVEQAFDLSRDVQMLLEAPLEL
jgi:hypothetical protein